MDTSHVRPRNWTGRPPKGEATRRNRVSCYVTDKEIAQLETVAIAADKSISELVRTRLVTLLAPQPQPTASETGDGT